MVDTIKKEIIVGIVIAFAVALFSFIAWVVVTLTQDTTVSELRDSEHMLRLNTQKDDIAGNKKDIKYIRNIQYKHAEQINKNTTQIDSNLTHLKGMFDWEQKEQEIQLLNRKLKENK